MKQWQTTPSRLGPPLNPPVSPPVLAGILLITGRCTAGILVAVFCSTGILVAGFLAARNFSTAAAKEALGAAMPTLRSFTWHVTKSGKRIYEAELEGVFHVALAVSIVSQTMPSDFQKT